MPLTVVQVAFPFATVGPDAVGGAEQVLARLDDEHGDGVRGGAEAWLRANGLEDDALARLRDRLTAIQRGAAPDPHGWMTRLR